MNLSVPRYTQQTIFAHRPHSSTYFLLYIQLDYTLYFTPPIYIPRKTENKKSSLGAPAIISCLKQHKIQSMTEKRASITRTVLTNWVFLLDSPNLQEFSIFSFNPRPSLSLLYEFRNHASLMNQNPCGFRQGLLPKCFNVVTNNYFPSSPLDVDLKLSPGNVQDNKCPPESPLSNCFRSFVRCRDVTGYL